MDQFAAWDAKAGERTQLPLVIDCDLCVARGPACRDCMVTVLLGPTPEAGFAEEEARALQALADGGLIPPLRMVHSVSEPQLPMP